MKKTFLGLAAGLLILACTDDCTQAVIARKSSSYSAKGSEKVTICHKDTTTMEISIKALQTHLDHGDSVGKCSGTLSNDSFILGERVLIDCNLPLGLSDDGKWIYTAIK